MITTAEENLTYIFWIIQKMQFLGHRVNIGKLFPVSLFPILSVVWQSSGKNNQNTLYLIYTSSLLDGFHQQVWFACERQYLYAIYLLLKIPMSRFPFYFVHDLFLQFDILHHWHKTIVNFFQINMFIESHKWLTRRRVSQWL